MNTQPTTNKAAEKEAKRLMAIAAAKEAKDRMLNEMTVLEAESKAELIRSVEERKQAILDCNGDKQAIWKIHPTDENRRLLVSEIATSISKAYFAGQSKDRTYIVELSKQGLQAFVVDSDGQPVKDSNGLNLIKSRKIDQVLGLILKHNRIWGCELISDIFKLDSVVASNEVAFRDVAQIFTFSETPKLETVLSSFSTIQIKSENTLTYGTKGDGTLSVKERLIVADSTRNEVNGIKVRYKANLMLKIKAVNGKASETLRNAKKGLK